MNTMSNTRKEIASRLGIAARLGSKLKMEMSPYDFKVAKSDLLFYIKDNLNLLADQQKQLGRINLKQLSPEDVAMAKQVTNEIQSFKSQLTALQAKANAVSDLKTAQQEIASLMTQLTRTADAIRPKVSGPISSLQQAAQRAQVRTAVQNEPRIPGWIRIMKDQIRQAEKGAKGVDRKSDARDAYDQLIQSLQWIVRGLLNNDARQVNGAIFDLKTTRMPPAPDNNWRDWVPDDMVKWAATESKGRNGRSGSKDVMGLLDRLSTAASAAVSAATAKPFDPTNPQMARDLEAAKKAAISEVNNYKFMVDFNDAQFKALDDYVKATAKSIAGLRSAQDVIRLTEGIKQATAARNMIRKTMKTPFSRLGAKAEMAASISRGIDTKKGGQWITGTWDGGTWGALVFSEPSEAYGIPEFPHISKFYMNPKGMPGFGDVIVNYERGWDIKPATPELQKAYREIAQMITAAAKKAAAAGWYSRPGAKAKFDVGEVRQVVNEFIADLPAGATRDALQRALFDYADNTAAQERLLQRGNKTDVIRLDGEIRRAHQIAVASWQRLGGAARMGELGGVLHKLGQMRFSRLGKKSAFGSKRTTAGALRKQLKAQGITDAADLEWHGISASDPDNTPYWLHEDGSMEKIKNSRPGAKATMSAQQTVAMNVDRAEQAISRGDRESARKWIKAAQDALDDTVTAGGLRKRLEQLATRYKMAANEVEETEEQKAGLKLMAASDEAVSNKIRTLIAEGKPQDQAVAIALDMKRRGEL